MKLGKKKTIPHSNETKCNGSIITERCKMYEMNIAWSRGITDSNTMLQFND